MSLDEDERLCSDAQVERVLEERRVRELTT
jgi:hypothetical protein